MRQADDRPAGSVSRGWSMSEPHRYTADPHSNARPALCRCGMANGWRYHQPWWWRVSHPGKRWKDA